MHAMIISVTLVLLFNLEYIQSTLNDNACAKSATDCDLTQHNINSSSNSNNNTKSKTNEINDNNVCKLYMAESSIPNAGI